MKLSENQRLTLENIQLKRTLAENVFINLQKQMDDLIKQWDGIMGDFCKTHNLDPLKVQINLQTGEVLETKEE